MNFLCLLCHETAQKNLALCKECKTLLPYYNQVCGMNDKEFSMNFDKAVIVCDYAFPADRLVTQLKFEHRLINANLIAQLLLNKIIAAYHNTPLPSLIIPVPLHPLRLKERGFNQALEISKFISKKLHISIDKSRCCRTKHTATQTSLSKSERLKNLDHAFEIKKTLKATHVAILDDVITTGKTVAELARVLHKNGVFRIDLWCFAKTPL